MATAQDRIGQADEDMVEFGPFRLDRAHRLLTKVGASVPLGDRAFEILQVLVGHAPDVVSKAALFEQVWPGTFIEESTLRYHLWTLRKALGDGEAGSRYISTANGRGYCFVAPLSHAPAVATMQSNESGNAATATQPPATNLPLRQTEIIGREREFAELADWLKPSRLVTLVGPGGVGKTRLAVELGWRLLGEFPAGVWLVDLAPLGDQDAMASAVAAALGVPVMKADAAVDAIVGALGKTPRLLIFDNCEHLAEAAAALIKTLLERVPGVSILATSQKNLQLAAERIYGLDPLAVPPAGAVEIGGYAAVELFTRSARATDRLFELHDGNNTGVGEICRHLDGLPLALEMAAGRLRLLGVEGLRRGLGDRLRMLKGAPDGDARHGSLHGMLEWSHSLLAPFDQQVFRRLAVFPASFSLEAAVAVAGGDEADRWEVVDALSRLIDQSLVTFERHEPVRYRLLETLRLYAMDNLRQAGEADAIAELHARHFIEVFDEGERCWEETPAPDRLVRYRPELDNHHAALDWALAAPERRHVAIALMASGSLLLYGLLLISEGRGYQERIIPLVDAETAAATTARLLRYASGFCRLVEDPRGLTYAERSAALYRDLNDGLGLGTSLLTIAHDMAIKGQFAEAKDALLEARHLLADSAFKKSQLSLMVCTGLVSYRTGDIPTAHRCYLEALELARKLNPRVEPTLLINLGTVEYILGNVDQAIEFTQAALNRSRSVFGNICLGDIFINLGTYLITKGQISEARSRLEQAFSTLVERGNCSAELCLRAWAGLAGAEGRLVEAAQLVGFADADRARRGRIMDPESQPLYIRLRDILEAGLPSAELDALKAEGAQWSEAEAIDFVVNRLLQAPASGDVVPP